MWSLRPMPTTGRPGGVTPRASSPGRWTSNSASCSGIWKPSCGPVNSHARPLPRTAHASEPPRTSAAAAIGAFGGRWPRRKRIERLKPAFSSLRDRPGVDGNAPLAAGTVVT